MEIIKHTHPRAIKLKSKGLVFMILIVANSIPLAQAQEAFRVGERHKGLQIIIEL